MVQNTGLVGMSEYSFNRAFRARTNLSPYQWVLERRLNSAERLIRSSAMSLAEVAFAVGISSQSHMTSFFKKRVGVTPAQLRK